MNKEKMERRLVYTLANVDFYSPLIDENELCIWIKREGQRLVVITRPLEDTHPKSEYGLENVLKYVTLVELVALLLQLVNEQLKKYEQIIEQLVEITEEW